MSTHININMTDEQKARCWELVIEEYNKYDHYREIGEGVCQVVENAKSFFGHRK